VQVPTDQVAAHGGVVEVTAGFAVLLEDSRVRGHNFRLLFLVLGRREGVGVRERDENAKKQIEHNEEVHRGECGYDWYPRVVRGSVVSRVCVWSVRGWCVEASVYAWE
jgi:hypothetical protein